MRVATNRKRLQKCAVISSGFVCILFVIPNIIHLFSTVPRDESRRILRLKAWPTNHIKASSVRITSPFFNAALMLSSRWCWQVVVTQHGLRFTTIRTAHAGVSRNIRAKAQSAFTSRLGNVSLKAPYMRGQYAKSLSTKSTSRPAYNPTKYRPRKANTDSTSPPILTRAYWTERLKPYLTRSFFKLLVKFVVTSYLAVHFLTIFYTIKGTYGPSMLPTISWDKEAVLISNFFHRRGRNISVGDVISFEHPVRPGYKSIKRVIGMPGDFVCRDTPGKGKGWLVQVPEGSCWVTGDNLGASRDSRMFGPIPLALVRGKVVAAWSWGRWLRWMGNTLEDADGFGLEEEVQMKEEGRRRRD